MFDLFLLALMHRLLLRQLLCALFLKLAVVPGVQAYLSVFEVGDTGSYPIEKIAVMGN